MTSVFSLFSFFSTFSNPSTSSSSFFFFKLSQASTMSTFNLPAEFGYVILGQIGAFVALQYMGTQVMKARKEYKVPYPDLYAPPSNEKAKEFNCVQRGHQNALETYPTFIVFNIVGGLFHPVPAAVLSVLWSIGRILYQKGYSTGNPDKRYSYGGMLHWISIFGSIGIAGHGALRMLGYL